MRMMIFIVIFTTLNTSYHPLLATRPASHSHHRTIMIHESIHMSSSWYDNLMISYEKYIVEWIELQARLAEQDPSDFICFKILQAHVLPLTNCAFNKSGAKVRNIVIIVFVSTCYAVLCLSCCDHVVGWGGVWYMAHSFHVFHNPHVSSLSQVLMIVLVVYGILSRVNPVQP